MTKVTRRKEKQKERSKKITRKKHLASDINGVSSNLWASPQLSLISHLINFNDDGHPQNEYDLDYNDDNLL